MIALLADASSTKWIVLGTLAILGLLGWAWTKYKESQAEKSSAELRALYASTHNDRRKAS
jgi:hypothetical protein